MFERASVQEARSLLSEAARTAAPTLIWNPSHETPLAVAFSHVSEKDGLIRLARPKERLPRAFLKTFEDEDSAGQFFVFSVKIPKANFFFRAEYLAITALALEFAYPAKIFKVQRRKAKRFRVQADKFLMVEFQDPHPPHEKIRKKVYDLSREGLSFVISDSSFAAYKRGLRIEGLTVLLGTKKITVNAEVLNARALPATFREKGVHVGVRFLEMNEAESEMLGAFVEREIQQELAKRLG